MWRSVPIGVLGLVAFLCICVGGDGLSRPLAAQVVALAERGPRFLKAGASGGAPVEIDVSRSPVLRRVVSLNFERPVVGRVLAAIERQTGLEFGYSRAVVPLERPVSLRADSISVAAALMAILVDTGVDVLLTTGRRVLLVRRTAGQTASIAGRVTDGKTGDGLAGAEVFLEGTQWRASTGADGRYRLSEVVPGSYTLAARRLGYGRQNQAIAAAEGAELIVDVALQPVATQLDEIVTTVTGDQRRLEVGHTVVSIRADSLLRTAPVMSFGDLIQGRAPGVLSMTSSNNVGQAGTIRIRGLNSFGVPNDPILVVDGVRIEASAGSGSTRLTPVTSPTAGGLTGRLADLNPDEIESVEIVKGPSAATLYGTDAANGVLVITTKRGQPGRPRWAVFTVQGVLEQRLEDWGALYGGNPYYAFGHTTTTGAPVRCTLLLRAAGSCVVDSLVSFNAFTHPETRPFRNSTREQYGLQVSGGTTGGTTYFLGGEYEEETGTAFMAWADQAFLRAQRGVTALPEWQVRPNAYEKVNLRANITAPVGQRGTVALATGFTSNEARQRHGLASEPAWRQVGYRDVNDGWILTERPAYFFPDHGSDVARRFMGSVSTNYRAREWLTLRGTVGADLSSNSYGRLIRRGEAPPSSPTFTGQRTANELDIARYSLDFGATATRALSSAVSSKTSIGVQYNRRAQRGSTVDATNLPVGGETIAGAASPLVASEGTLTTAVAGGYVEEALGFRDRLFLTGAVRLDGGSAFGQNFSVAVYPKASLSWVVSDGEHGPRLPGVSSLRLRAAYGASGVQPGPVAALQQLQVIAGVSGTAAAPGAQLGAFGNPNLKPERTSELEAGLDLEAAAGRLRLEFTAYQRTSDDALVNRPLAPDVGGGTRWENLGVVRNRGLELLLSADALGGRVLAAGLTVTGLLNENRLLEVGEGVVVSSPTAQSFRQDVGYPLQGIWARGVASYADANGNGIIEPGEITLTDNQYIGPAFPTREAAAAPYLGLFAERLRLGALFQYRGGFYQPNFSRGNACRFEQSCREMNDISTPLADQARAVAYAQFAASAWTFEPASYLSLREVSASLTMPAAWARLLRARDVHLMLAARNVALLWRQGTAPAPESSRVSRDQAFVDIAGPPTYWLLRFNLNY